MNTADSTTAGTVKSDSTKPKLNLNVYTAESAIVESVKSGRLSTGVNVIPIYNTGFFRKKKISNLKG